MAVTRLRALTGLALLLSCPATVAMAVTDGWMAESDIRRELTGHAMKGYYPRGERWVDDYAADGTIAYHDEHVAWTGQWSFHGNVFCTFYNGEMDGGCYLLRQLSKNCFEYVLVPSDWRGPGLAPGAKPDWFARGWRGEEPTTCDEPVVS